MHTLWRWDQGREEYWRYERIRAMAVALTELDGVRLRRHPDPLASMRASTGLPFAIPRNQPSYNIWRQYARVFHSTLLATKVSNRLQVTDLAKELASSNDPLPMDNYLALFATRFYCPFPAFGTSYDSTADRVYPICVLVRYLIAKYKALNVANIDVPEVFSILIGNDCIGNESIQFYQDLTPTGYAPPDDIRARQVKEMLRCFSQLSFLYWDGTRVHFGSPSLAAGVLAELYNAFKPYENDRSDDRELELLELGRLANRRFIQLPKALELPLSEEDIQFVEGRKSRATHLITERNPRLRELFLEHLALSQSPILCNMCGVDLNWRYPWTSNLLEVHHLLPLSSPAEVLAGGTSIRDLVAVCPSCHRAVHSYYRIWLHEQGRFDFTDRAEAKKVYEEAKNGVQIGVQA